MRPGGDGGLRRRFRRDPGAGRRVDRASLPPTVFWPRPKVDSAVIAIRPDAVKRAAVGDVAWFHEIVRRLFFHRRKYIRHVLADTWRDRWTKAEVDTWLATQGFSGQLRAESLNVDEFLCTLEGPPRTLGDLPGAALAHARATTSPRPGLSTMTSNETADCAARLWTTRGLRTDAVACVRTMSARAAKSRVAGAGRHPRDRRVFERESAAVGDFVPDLGQLVKHRLRVLVCPVDMLVERGPKSLHIFDTEQTRVGHGDQQGARSIDGVMPPGGVDADRYDHPQRVDRRRDPCCPISGQDRGRGWRSPESDRLSLNKNSPRSATSFQISASSPTAVAGWRQP